MTEKVITRCSWTQTAGNELSELVQTRLSEDDVFVKPDLDDAIKEERAVLFSDIDSPGIPCELQFKISPRFKIAALTIVCSAPKLELFLGPAQEYFETIYGILIDEDGGDVLIQPYRYDVEIDRSGIADIDLKLLTSAKEVFIYGAMLHIAPNPNGITTQLQKPFDLVKIQELLQRGGSSGSQSKTEDNEEKIQKFMSIMKGITSHSQSQEPAPDADTNLVGLYQHIDSKLEQLELNISKRLDEFEAQQTEKLDKIIAILENKN
ncbi:uncharacterized protein LOC117792233 [Drosophila innubila]|uniref:uncharacterized protein LOC117792233 n=1 Tax=Drosophila innubila TaxID=198719 RepID=UPI00148BB436|nr:uncharacterized protein LOC117792233 [Drosophila innubila]